jgi:hypothetical protein
MWKFPPKIGVPSRSRIGNPPVAREQLPNALSWSSIGLQKIYQSNPAIQLAEKLFKKSIVRPKIKPVFKKTASSTFPASHPTPCFCHKHRPVHPSTTTAPKTHHTPLCPPATTTKNLGQNRALVAILQLFLSPPPWICWADSGDDDDVVDMAGLGLFDQKSVINPP